MKFKSVLLGAIVLMGVTVWAQEFPRTEIGFDYSYMRYSPSAPYSKGHSLNGGGGSITFNINEYLGIKMDLQGFGSNHTAFNIAPNATFPSGLHGDVQGNFFSYLFGPQVKIRTHGIQPFAHALFGAAHSNTYTDAFKTFCVVGACSFSSRPASDAFAMEIGGGVDIPINHVVSFRPAELDYMITRFSNPFTGASNQHNFRYKVGVLFTLDHVQQ